LINIFVFCLSMYILIVQHLQQSSHLFWTGKTTRKIVLFPLYDLQNLPSMFQYRFSPI
jgi:hypothetical protein